MSTLALACLLLGAPLSASLTEPLVLVIHAPYAEPRDTLDRAAIVAAARAALVPELRVWVSEPPDTPELRRAAGRVTPLLRLLRPDLADPTIRADACRSRPTTERSPRLILVLTVLQSANGLRLSSRLAEVYSTACTPTDDIDPLSPDDEALLARGPSVTVDHAAQVPRYLGATLAEDMMPALRRAGFERGRGRLTITSVQPGDVVHVDDRVLGEASAAQVDVTEVPSGERHVALTRAGTPILDTWVSASDATPTTIDLLALSPPSTERTALRWSGAGLVVAGAALTLSGALVAGERYRCVDFAVRTGPCPAAPWRSLGDGGPAWVPLGLSLLGTGAVWGLGPSLVETEAEVPWRSLVAGVVFGALTYGLSVALAPSSLELAR